MVLPGQYNRRIDHFAVLRVLEAMYEIPYAGASANAVDITGWWK